MDTGEGRFIPVDLTEKDKQRIDDVAENGSPFRPMKLIDAQFKYPKHGGTFYIGQNISLNGSRFRVLKIEKRILTLKLLPSKEG
jgi:hypothetical protein